MSRFFQDCISDENINWGSVPLLKIRHKIRKNEYGTIKVERQYDEDFDVLSSPQPLDADEIENAGYGAYANGEVYSVFTLEDIPLNSDSKDYRTIIFNEREYEIIHNSFFGVNKGNDFEDGYYEITFARRIDNLGVSDNVD